MLDGPQDDIDTILYSFNKIHEILFKNNLELLMMQNSFPRTHLFKFNKSFIANLANLKTMFDEQALNGILTPEKL